MRAKLASTSGASIALAVVIFAIASIFSVTIVNAALSSAGNAVDQVADEQEFLSASSAAKLLQDIVPGAGKSVSLEGLNAVVPSEMHCTVPTTAGNAAPLLKAMGDSLLPTGENASRESKTVTFGAVQAGSVGANGSAANAEMPAITVTMIPSDNKESYDVTALVKGEKGNAMAVYFTGYATQGDNATNVSWQVDSVGKQKAANQGSGKQGS